MDDLTYQDQEDARVLSHKLGLSRRQMLAATTGMAAAALFGLGSGHAHASTGAAAANGAVAAKGGNGVLVPPGKRGIILYTVRDAISRNPLTTDPSLPSGFKAVLEQLAKIGYKQIEFAGYTQNSNSPGGNVNNVEGAHLLRKWLDDNGLEGEGNHGSIPSTITDATIAQFDAQCEIANILGFGHIGTGMDPVAPGWAPGVGLYKSDWDKTLDVWNYWGARAQAHGLKLYTHNHQFGYDFLLDSGPLDAAGNPTRSSGVRRLEYFLNNTDPNGVFFELDIYWAHVAQHLFHTYTAPDGSTVQSVFDPAALVAANSQRFPLFHAKDGRRNPNSPNGYDIVSFGQGDIDFTTFFQRVGTKGYRNPMWEQDNAGGGSANPAQSLQNAESSYANLAALRG
jgi:sugar phosphate isomerase/epimerase